MKKQLLDEIVQKTGLSLSEVQAQISEPKDLLHGDLSFPCFALAKKIKKNPTLCAKEIAEQIQMPRGFTKIEVVNAYLNFFYDRKVFSENVIKSILNNNFIPKLDQPETIVIDFSSPNIAKPFHVGHLRTTAIGNSLGRVFKLLGHNVISINHLGDWGTQFGFVYAGVKLFGKPQQETIQNLVDLYRRASLLRKAQEENQLSDEEQHYPNVNELAREYFLRLEIKEQEAFSFWKWCLDLSLKYLKEIYKRLGVNFDHYTGESFYQDKLEDVKQRLDASQILENSRNAIGVDLGDPLGFARIYSEDGRSLYLARDLAAVFYRKETYSPDRMIYVVGAPQILHFQQIKAILNKMNDAVSEKIIHVAFGHVPGIGTRSGSGDRFDFSELMDEAHNRALEAYRSEVAKRPEELDEEKVAESVGIGALYFNYLVRTNIKDFHFKWEDALNFQGDTGPYLQYALARLTSIKSKAILEKIDSTGFNGDHLIDDQAFAIVRHLAKFPDILKQVTVDYEPCHICIYALELAKLLASSYKELRVIGANSIEISKARLALYEACQYVLKAALNVIGVPALERM